jgi:hypothetical protein
LMLFVYQVQPESVFEDEL